METENKDLDSVVHRNAASVISNNVLAERLQERAEHSQNNITINQPSPDKTSGAGLNDEVKVVGFANDSDLTVLNSPAKSQKSPDIER